MVGCDLLSSRNLSIGISISLSVSIKHQHCHESTMSRGMVVCFGKLPVP